MAENDPVPTEKLPEPSPLPEQPQNPEPEKTESGNESKNPESPAPEKAEEKPAEEKGPREIYDLAVCSRMEEIIEEGSDKPVRRYNKTSILAEDIQYFVAITCRVTTNDKGKLVSKFNTFSNIAELDINKHDIFLQVYQKYIQGIMEKINNSPEAKKLLKPGDAMYTAMKNQIHRQRGTFRPPGGGRKHR